MPATRPPTSAAARVSPTDHEQDVWPWSARADARCASGWPAQRTWTMKFYSKPLEEHAEVPLADDGRWEAIVAHWTRREAPQRGAAPSGNACFVLSVHRPGDRGDPSAQLAEMTSLVMTQGDRV